MADPNPTVGELFKAKAVTDDEVSAAVEAYQADPRTTSHPIADGYSLDLAAAVAGHGWASAVVANPESNLRTEARGGSDRDPAGAGADGMKDRRVRTALDAEAP